MKQPTMQEVLGPDGPLAQALDSYEYRPQQVEMAEAIARTLDEGGTVLVEAGPGTGKTFAYLIPAIYSGQRVVVSTGTKNLQEQLFFRDIPLLKEILPVKFTAAYLKGRENYLCPAYQQLFRHARPVLERLAAHLTTGRTLADFAPRSGSGAQRNARCPCGSGRKYKHCCGA